MGNCWFWSAFHNAKLIPNMRSLSRSRVVITSWKGGETLHLSNPWAHWEFVVAFVAETRWECHFDPVARLCTQANRLPLLWGFTRKNVSFGRVLPYGHCRHLATFLNREGLLLSHCFQSGGWLEHRLFSMNLGEPSFLSKVPLVNFGNINKIKKWPGDFPKIDRLTTLQNPGFLWF